MGLDRRGNRLTEERKICQSGHFKPVLSACVFARTLAGGEERAKVTALNCVLEEANDLFTSSDMGSMWRVRKWDMFTGKDEENLRSFLFSALK